MLTVFVVVVVVVVEEAVGAKETEDGRRRAFAEVLRGRLGKKASFYAILLRQMCVGAFTKQLRTRWSDIGRKTSARAQQTA